MANGANGANGTAAGESSPGDDSIARLMQLAGPRPAVPQAVRERVHATVKREWRSSVTRRRARRWGWAMPAALAASVLLAVVLGDRMLLDEGAPVATVSVASGPGGTLRAGDAIHAGDAISTGGAGVALAFESGLSLRLAAHTAATVDAVDEITVSAGKVYADTGPSMRADRAITVHTGVGSATDHGTQFIVGYDGTGMTVAVREGRVEIAAGDTSYTADAGEQVTLAQDREARFARLPPHDPSWDWASELAPSFDIERRPVMDFLQWAARETGRQLVFTSDGARVAAMVGRLRGSIEGLTPTEAIEAVRPTIPGLELRIDDRTMVVSLSD